MAKFCTQCKEEKTSELFYKNKNHVDGLATTCKTCINAYRKLPEYKEKRQEESKKRWIKIKNTALNPYKKDGKLWESKKIANKFYYDMVNSLKQATPCFYCKNQYPYYIMEFDHRDIFNKKYNISRLVAGYVAITDNNTSKLLSEINKCDIICANCHKARTFSNKENILLKAAQTREKNLGQIYGRSSF